MSEKRIGPDRVDYVGCDRGHRYFRGSWSPDEGCTHPVLDSCCFRPLMVLATYRRVPERREQTDRERHVEELWFTDKFQETTIWWRDSGGIGMTSADEAPENVVENAPEGWSIWEGRKWCLTEADMAGGEGDTYRSEGCLVGDEWWLGELRPATADEVLSFFALSRQGAEGSLYDIAAQADPSHLWHLPTPDGVCRQCGYDATDQEAKEPCSRARPQEEDRETVTIPYNPEGSGRIALEWDDGWKVVPAPEPGWILACRASWGGYRWRTPITRYTTWSEAVQEAWSLNKHRHGYDDFHPVPASEYDALPAAPTGHTGEGT